MCVHHEESSLTILGRNWYQGLRRISPKAHKTSDGWIAELLKVGEASVGFFPRGILNPNNNPK